MPSDGLGEARAAQLSHHLDVSGELALELRDAAYARGHPK
jgi:hypothetical protein